MGIYKAWLRIDQIWAIRISKKFPIRFKYSQHFSNKRIKYKIVYRGKAEQMGYTPAVIMEKKLHHFKINNLWDEEF